MESKKSKTVFVDGYLLNKEYQGTYTYISGLYRAFADLRPDFKIVIGCLEKKSLQKIFCNFPNVELLEYKYSSRLIRMFVEIPKIIQKQQADFAHFQYVIPFKKRRETIYVNTLHDNLIFDFPQYFPKDYLLKRMWLFKRAAKSADILLTVSEYSKNSILKMLGINRKIFVIPNGVNPIYFDDFGADKFKEIIKENFGIKNFILNVSRIEPRKNQAKLLKVFLEEDLARHHHLVFIGERSISYPELEKETKNLSLEQKKRVHFLENISEEDLITFYRSSEAFVYPSLAEGFGIPPLEAAAVGIPVLCSDRTAMANYQFFKPNFFNLENIEVFKRSFKGFLESKNSIDLRYIKESVQKRYNWQKSAEQLSEIFNNENR